MAGEEGTFDLYAPENSALRRELFLQDRAMKMEAGSASDEDAAWAANYLSKRMTGIDTVDGAVFNDSVPMAPRDFLAKMQGAARARSLDSLKSGWMRRLEAIPNDAPDAFDQRLALADEYAKSHDKSPVNNALGTAASRIATAGRVTDDEMGFLDESERTEAAALNQAMASRPYDDFNPMAPVGMMAPEEMAAYAAAAKAHAENAAERKRIEAESAPRIRELKDVAEKRRRVTAFENAVADENAWIVVAHAKNALGEKARGIIDAAEAHKDDMEAAVGDAFAELAREDPKEAARLAPVLHALHFNPAGNTVAGDAWRAFKRVGTDTVVGAGEALAHTFERGVVNGGEYQARREREALYRRAFAEKEKEHDWWGDAAVGFFATLPYMGAAAIPYVGPAAIALSAANDFEKQVADAGGDVSDPDFFFGKFAVGATYAAIERMQVIHPLRKLGDFATARAYAEMFSSVSAFLKVAAHQGMHLGGEVWEEGLQGALEKGFVAYGCGQDVAAAAAKGLVQDMHGSIGAFMPLMAIEGAGARRMHRHGGLTGADIVAANEEIKGFSDRLESLTAEDATHFGEAYGAMAVAWANAGPDAGRRSKALQARFGLNADDAAMADEVLSRLWKAVAATGDKEAVGEFFAGASLKSAADMLKATLRDATVTDNDDGTQTVSGFIGESGHEVSFTIGREDLALDVTSEAQAPSIVEALNRYGYEGGKLTVEAWLAKSVEERQKLAALYTLGSQGYTVNRKISVKTKRTLEDGTEEVVENTLDAKALRILSGDIVLDENTLPQTVFHEAMHGLLKLAEDVAPKELMDALREAYPATTEGETVNEERIANAYRDYLAGKIPAVEYEKDIFDRLVAWIRGLLGLSDASLTIANARTSADVLFNQMLSGDFSGVVEAEKMLDVQLARIERREAGRRAEAERAAERKEAEKKDPAPDGGTENLGKDKFGGEIVAAEDEMVDEDGNVVPPEKIRDAIAAGKIVMRREVYEAKKGEIAPNLTDEERRRAWHLANDDYAGTDEQGRAEVPTPDGAMKVNTQLAVVDRGELITSDDPRFPQDVQNRLGRETSPQVDAIAQAPNPLWLGPAKDTADGAPLVYPWKGGYIVIAGNGRVLGLAKGDDEYKSTDAYNSYAMATGERFGLNVPDTAHPRLVRVITDSLTDEQLNRLGRLSNKSGKRAEGAVGTRKSDGMAVRDNLGLVSPDMGASLRSPENSAFAFAVASDIGENGLLTSDEMGVAQSGYDRVENALLGWIVNHHERRDAIQRALEEQGTAGHPDLGIGNILNGIKASAIHLAALAGAEGREAYDIAPDIADALKDYIDFRQGGGTDIDAFLAQGDMFQNRPSLTEAIMREFFARRNSAKRVQAILDKYAETAMLQDNATPTLLDMGETAREDVWKLAVEKADAAEESQRRDSVTGHATSADTDGATAEDVAEAARQYAEVEARYTNPDGTRKPGWMMAPNGKPTNLTERQWVQVRTENFKKWFGDWENGPANASKVVDENGEPLVVWHGSNHTHTVFDNRKSEYRNGTPDGVTFLTDARNVAASYTPGERGEDVVLDENGRPFVDVRFKDGHVERQFYDLGGVYATYLSLKNPMIVEASGAEWSRIQFEGKQRTTNEIAEIARARGYDGVIFNGVVDGAMRDRPAPSTTFASFSPFQIKSATDNVGTFSEARPDIRYSVQANPNLLRDVEAALVVRTEDNPAAKPMKRHEEIVFSRNIPFFDFLGLPNERVVTDTSRVRKMQQNHKLTPQQIATLPDHYNSPVAVMRGDDGGYHVLTDVEAPDRDGNIKPVVVYLRPTTRRDGEVVFLASAYAPDKKKESEYYTPLLGANVLFVDENKVAGLSLEEETRSILRTRASGDDVLTASDYSWWSTKNSIPQSGAEGKENLDRRDSVTGVTPAEDAAYMDAVNRGDMETAERMVREAARRAGYNHVAYHGTPFGGWNQYDFSRGGMESGNGRGVISLTSDRGEAEAYSKSDSAADVSDVMFKVNNILAQIPDEAWSATTDIGMDGERFTFDSSAFSDYADEFTNMPDEEDFDSPAEYRQAAQDAEREGYLAAMRSVLSDMKGVMPEQGAVIDEAARMLDNASSQNPEVKSLHVRIVNAFEADATPQTYGRVAAEAERAIREGGNDGAIIHLEDGTLRYFVKDSSQIKSADPVTYDDAGNVIPLSQRFNQGMADIRYSIGSIYTGTAADYAGQQRNSVAGRATPAENVEAAKTEAQRVLDLIGGTELGNAINRDFKGEGETTIIGRTVRTAGDLAAAAQIYRNPCFETLRYFFTKNGKVVWQTSLTARKPSSSPAFVRDAARHNETLAEFNRMAHQLKPDGMWMLHNHPSGDVTPSHQDIALTAHLAQMHEGMAIAFKGHVIIDHDKYAYIPSAYRSAETRERDFSRSRASYHGAPTETDAPFPLGAHISDPISARGVALAAVEAQKAATIPGAALTLIATDAKSDVRSIATIPTDEILGLLAEGVLQDYATATGGASLFLVGDTNIENYPVEVQSRLLGMVGTGTVTDFIYEDGEGGYSVRWARLANPAPTAQVIARRVAESSGPRFSVTSLMAGGDATRDLAETAEPTPDDIARALEKIAGTGGAQLGADLSKKENAKAFRDWIKALPKTEPPAWLRDGSPKAVFEWYEANMVGKVYSFDIPGYGHREFRPAPGHIGTLVCGGSNKGVIKKPVVGSWMEMVRNGEISGEDVSGWDYKRARMLPRIPIVLTDFDAVVHEVDRGSDVFTFIKKFDTKNGRPNTIVMKLIDDGKTIGPITTHVKDLTMSWLAKKDLILTEGGEVYGRGANNSASRTPFARDNAEGNSQALETSISQTGAEDKQIPQSAADILDGPPAGFRASVTGSAPTGKYGRNDYVVAMAAQDKLRGIDRPPRKYAELAEALGATRFKDDDGSAWVRLADELIEKNRDKLARLAERDIREAVRETARMKAEADFSEHVKKLFTGSARFGEEIGSAGTSAWLKIMRDLAARAPGYDLDAMRRDTGADLLLSLMEIMPEKFAPSEDEGNAKGEGEAGGEEGEAGQDGEFVGPPTPQTWEEWQRNAEERRKHYNAVILLAKEWIKKRQAEIQARENARAKREAEEEARRKAEAEGAENAGVDAESGTDEEGAEPEEDVGPLAIPREVIEAAGVDLQNADEFAAFMRAWICDWLVRQNPGTTYADVLDDEARLATYRRTMIAQLRDIADALLDPTEGKASIFAERMIADIRENASANELERRTSDILGFIQRNAIRQKRKGLIADLLKMIEAQAIRGRKFDALERDMKRKIRGDHEQYCRYIARVIQMSDNAVAKETEALMQIIEGRKADYEQAAAEYGVELNFQSDVEIHRAYEKLAALQQFGGLKNKMPSYIVAASKRLEEWLGNERMEHERRWGEFQAVCDDVAQAIEAGVKARRDKYAKKEPGLGGRMWQDVEASVRQRLEEMLVGAGPERVEAIAKVMRVLSEGSQTLEVKKMEYRRQFERMMKTAVEGTDLDVKGLLNLLDKEIPEELNDVLDADLYDADGQLVHERQRVRMTWGQAIQLYSSLLQTATYGANIALHGRQDHARAIEEAAHPALIRLAGLMRGIYQERREELSGVVAQVTGLGIFNPDPMYMPAKMNTGMREGLDQKAYAWSPLAKSLTPRVKNRLDFDLTASVMDVFRQRSNESARAIAFGVRGMALRSMLARKSVVDAMARTHGTLPTRRLIEQVTDTLTGGYTLDEARGGIMGLVQSAGTFTTYASLSFNLVTALKQMQSVASWAPLLQGGYLELGRHIVNFNMDAARELCQAPGFVARYGETSFGRMLQAALADKEGSLVSRLARAGMTLIQIGDFVPGVLVGTGVYKARVAALLRQNPNADVAAVKDQAATETWALVEECQQTSRLEDTPHMLRRWGVMGKQVTKFATAPIQQVAHEIHTWRMWHEAARLGDKETAAEYRRKCINTAIANHVILPAAFYAVATLFGMALGDEPPEEDELFGDLILQMLVGPFARVFFAGTIVNGLVAGGLRLTGLKPNVYPENAFPAAQTIDRLVKKGFMTASDIANADAQTVADDLLDEIGIVNAPVRYATKAARNYSGYDPKKHRREAIRARKAE